MRKNEKHPDHAGDVGVARRERAPGRRTLTEALPARVQRSGAAAPTPTMGDVATAAVDTKGAGAPLDGAVRRQIEPHLGTELAGVRVHADDQAQAAAAALGARAFTHGPDIFLGAGERATDTRLMAHETTHVVQQGAAPSPQRKVEVGAEDHPAEREADAVADRVAGGAPAGGRIVDDNATPTDGQMRRSEFLRALKAEVDQAAGAALGPLWALTGCPYIERWFAQHAATDAATLERMAVKFSGQKQVASAQDYMTPISARLQDGIARWQRGGDVAGELAAAGMGAAAAAAGDAGGDAAGAATGGDAAAAAGTDSAAGPAPAGAANAAAAAGGADAASAADSAAADASDAQGLAEMAAGPILQRKAARAGATASLDLDRPAASLDQPAAALDQPARAAALDPDQPARVTAELGAGEALDGGTASRMGGAFGQDFSHVRIHTDAAAARKANEVGAAAFTVGAHVAFSAGAYAPGSPAGDALLAHELAHVGQQDAAIQRKPLEGQDSVTHTHASGDGGALEADADLAALAVVERLHGDHSVAAPKAALRSELSLRRCESKKAAPSATPEIPATAGDMGKRVVDDMNKANAGPNTLDAGIHYWYNYRKLCLASDPGRWDDKLKAGMADATYWERYGWKQWRLKKGVSASEGLKSWIKGPTVAECRSAILAFETDAMRAAIGDAKFDDLFGSATKDVGAGNRLVIDSQGGDSSIEKYMKTTDASKAGTPGTVGNRPVQEGEWYYFYNHSMLLAKHPASSWQGENALYLGKDPVSGEQLWAGLGTVHAGKSQVTEAQMYQQMADTYNKPRNADDLAKLDEIKKDHGGTLPAVYDESTLPTSMDQAKILADPGSDKVDGRFRKGGFKIDSGVTLDADKIAKLK